MKALTKILAGGAIAAAALASAAPASAQYYPGYGYGYGSPYGYGSGAGIIGQVISSVIGGNQGYGYNGYNDPYRRYGAQGQYAINQCVGAVQQRLGAGYSGYGYGYAGGARVLGISDVEPRSNGGMTVRGVANSGRNAGYGYNGGGQVDLTFKCKTDATGYIVDIDIDQATSAYGNYGGYNGPSYTPYNYDYSQYGYRRY